jgi:acetyltransferase-like isoleucine patch superfamily enzyme
MKAKLRGSYWETPLISVTDDVVFGEGVGLSQFVNLYGCRIGDHTKIGAFTEIGSGVVVGDRCKIQANVFIPQGVTIRSYVFIGPGVIFTNDKHTSATTECPVERTLVDKCATIGAGAVILPGLTIGVGAVVGAGSVVTRNVRPGATVMGNPAKEPVVPGSLA